MEQQYYQICLRHMSKRDNVFQFWGKGSSGYYRNIENAELYQEDYTTNNFKEQVRDGDFLVEKEKLNSLLEEIRLPKYGDREETYCGLTTFFVLPNTGQVRKALGITLLDIHLDFGEANNSFTAYFRDTVREKLKTEYSKTHYTVNAKKSEVDEWWYCQDFNVESKTRNEAILKAMSEWNFEDDYIEFKSMVTCSRTRNTVFDKWIEL